MAAPNFENRTLFHGDNLDFLRSINSESIDLIATDPPFNKGRDFHATPESLASGATFQDRWRWDEDVHEAWIDQMQDDWPGVWAVVDWTRMTHSDALAAFLCFMAVRLTAMHRVLKPTGALYLHCDDAACAYLKTLLDAIFGKDSYRNSITWRRAIAHNDATRWGRISDTILFYTKTDQWVWNPLHDAPDAAELAKAFPKKDSKGRLYRSDNLTGPMHGGRAGGESAKPWKGYDVTSRNRVWSPPLKGDYAEYIERCWIPGYRSIRGVHARLDALDAAGLIEHPKRGFWPGLVRYAEGGKGKPQQDLVYNPTGLTNYNKAESTGYPTQKPLALYRKIIRSSTNSGDVVLDPFCGCATTPIAAELEGRQWLGADLWDMAPKMVTDRLAKEVAVGEGDQGDMLARKVIVRTDPLVRTDAGEVAAPTLKALHRTLDKPTMSRAKMIDELIELHGMHCQGCGFRFPHKGFVELDHALPRSEGGSNDIDNRILLCGPCNRLKSNTLTLTGLRKRNKQLGLLAEQLAAA